MVVAEDDVLPSNDDNKERTISQIEALADIAKTYGIVVVANLSEIVDKDTKDEKIYNTEVAISEKGVLLAKYHKLNPYYPKTFDTPSKETVVFTTSFGVKFGLFICKDMLHDEPQKSLLGKENVKHFPYSVAVPSPLANFQFPRWAKKNGATILASNLGHGGSDICGKASENVVEKKNCRNR